MADILVVDDHTIFRSGLKRLLSDAGEWRVSAEAGSSDSALTALRQAHFDLVILDINLNGRNGLEVLATLRRSHPTLPVLVMSMYPAEQFAAHALRDGAHAYLSKDATPELLFKVIQLLLSGQRYTANVPADAGQTDQGPAHYRLSPRELQILTLMVGGISLTEIGQRMFLSVKTVSTYRSRILHKLDIQNNAELVQYALRHGIGGL